MHRELALKLDRSVLCPVIHDAHQNTQAMLHYMTRLAKNIQ